MKTLNSTLAKKIFHILLGWGLFCLPLLVEAGPKIKPPSTQRSLGFFGLILMIFTIKLGFMGLILLYSVLRPQHVIRGSEVLGKRYLRSFFVGLLILIVYVLLLGGTLALPNPFRGISFLIMINIFFLQAVVGFCMVSHFVGERIQANLGSGSIGSSFIAVLWGAAILLLIDLVPLLGWLVSFLVLVLSLGTAITTRVRNKPELNEPEPANK